MTLAARLQATLDLMQEVDSVARPADAVVSAWFRTRRPIGDQDRRAISELLYTLLRHHARLSWWLAKHGYQAGPRHRLLSRAQWQDARSHAAGRNEDQVAAFLAAFPGFHVVPLREAAPQLTDSAHADYLSLTPARHDTDGFLAAVMQRDAATSSG